jgi:hypothetical protein
MQNLFIFLQYNRYNKNPLLAMINVEYINVCAACIRRLVQGQHLSVLVDDGRLACSRSPTNAGYQNENHGLPMSGGLPEDPFRLALKNNLWRMACRNYPRLSGILCFRVCRDKFLSATFVASPSVSRREFWFSFWAFPFDNTSDWTGTRGIRRGTGVGT